MADGPTAMEPSNGFAGTSLQSRPWRDRGIGGLFAVATVFLLVMGLEQNFVGNPSASELSPPSTLTIMTLAAAPAPVIEQARIPVGFQPVQPVRTTLPLPKFVVQPAASAPAIIPTGAPQMPPTLPSTAAPAPDAAPAPVDHTKLLDDYRRQLWAIIVAHRPPGIRLDGEVGIHFGIDPAGNLQSARIVQSSGDPMMDRLALDTVRRAGPFPRPPAQDPAFLSFEIRFRFR